MFSMIDQKTFITIVAAIITAEVLMTLIYQILGRVQGNGSSRQGQASS
jgi:hypothetical protein